jgi:hypothetical protein
MKTLLVGLLALTTLGGGAAALAPVAVHAFAADPTCTDVAGQATLCQEVAADPATGVLVYANADVHPTPPVAATAAADPTCTDVAGQATVCQEIAADPATGVLVDVDVDVHPTPPA